jgi:hypothetical protein
MACAAFGVLALSLPTEHCPQGFDHCLQKCAKSKNPPSSELEVGFLCFFRQRERCSKPCT